MSHQYNHWSLLFLHIRWTFWKFKGIKFWRVLPRTFLSCSYDSKVILKTSYCSCLRHPITRIITENLSGIPQCLCYVPLSLSLPLSRWFCKWIPLRTYAHTHTPPHWKREDILKCNTNNTHKSLNLWIEMPGLLRKAIRGQKWELGVRGE